MRFIHKISVCSCETFFPRWNKIQSIWLYILTSRFPYTVFFFSWPRVYIYMNVCIYASSSTENFEHTVKERFSALSHPNEVRKLLNGKTVTSSASRERSLLFGNNTNVGCPFMLLVLRALHYIFFQTVTTYDLLSSRIKKSVCRTASNLLCGLACVTYLGAFLCPWIHKFNTRFWESLNSLNFYCVFVSKRMLRIVLMITAWRWCEISLMRILIKIYVSARFRY